MVDAVIKNIPVWCAQLFHLLGLIIAMGVLWGNISTKMDLATDRLKNLEAQLTENQKDVAALKQAVLDIHDELKHR